MEKHEKSYLIYFIFFIALALFGLSMLNQYRIERNKENDIKASQRQIDKAAEKDRQRRARGLHAFEELFKNGVGE